MSVARRPTELAVRAAAVAPRLIDDFRRDGSVCLRGLLSPDEVATLARGIDANLAAPRPRAIVASRPDDPGRFVEDFCNWRGRTARAAARALRCIPRTPRRGHDSRADRPSTIDGMQNVSFSIPVDAVRRRPTLEFVAGPHRGPWLMPRTFIDGQATWFPAGSLAEAMDHAQFPLPVGGAA